MSKKLKIFTKADCPKCPAAKQLGKDLEKEGMIKVEFYDVDKSEGLAEAQFYSILATPTLVLCNEDEEEQEIKSFRGETPDMEEIKKDINN